MGDFGFDNVDYGAVVRAVTSESPWPGEYYDKMLTPNRIRMLGLALREREDDVSFRIMNLPGGKFFQKENHPSCVDDICGYIERSQGLEDLRLGSTLQDSSARQSSMIPARLLEAFGRNINSKSKKITLANCPLADSLKALKSLLEKGDLRELIFCGGNTVDPGSLTALSNAMQTDTPGLSRLMLWLCSRREEHMPLLPVRLDIVASSILELSGT
jgi:hypothetical protein